MQSRDEDRLAYVRNYENLQAHEVRGCNGSGAV
jgi:hypothetical protein